MSRRTDLGKLILAVLEPSYPLKKEEIGSDARLAKNGMVFETESYAMEGLGHLCILRMRTILGLMRMETVVLATTEKDVPLLNLDWVSVFGKETQIAELYDTQLQPWPDYAQSAFEEIKDRDADLPGMSSAGHWYDAILYPCSYHKAGKGLSNRLAASASDYIHTFVRQLANAPACDPAEKQLKVRTFAETLFAQGGPAVDQVSKLFGREIARRLILTHMYGIRPCETSREE